MKAFAINLKSATTRRQSLEKELKKSGLHVEFVEAVNGSELTQKDIATLCDEDAIRRSPQWLTPGAIGCALSHLAIYRKIVSDKLPYALIIEDDVEFSEGIAARLQELEAQIQQEEVIMLYYQSWKPLILKSASRRKIGTGAHALYAPANENQPITTGAYIISRAAAKRMAENLLPIHMGADSWGYFFKMGYVKSIHCVYPQLIWTKPYKTTIDYVQNQKLAQLAGLIDRYKIPVAYQLLKARRQRWLNKHRQVIFQD